MTDRPNSVPTGYHTISPYVVVRGGASAIEFYKAAFGATERLRWQDPDGRIRHAELMIGGSEFMLTDEVPDSFMLSPLALGGTTMHFHVYVADADAVAARAIAAGATELMPVADSNEDRRGGVLDPFGHIWWIAQRIEAITNDQLQERYPNSGQDASS